MTREELEIGLSLGSNLGDRLANFERAIHRIAHMPGVRIVDQSPIYETEPVDVEEGHRRFQFLNSVVIIAYTETTAESVRGLMRRFQHIEDTMGHPRTGPRNAPRRIDIDIVYAGDLTIDTEDLTVPHRRWAERRFVVAPLCDVRPDLRLPGASQAVRAILAGLPEQPAATRLADEQ